MTKYQNKVEALTDIENAIRTICLYDSGDIKDMLNKYAIIYNMPDNTTDIKIYADGHIYSAYILEDSKEFKEEKE